MDKLTVVNEFVKKFDGRVHLERNERTMDILYKLAIFFHQKHEEEKKVVAEFEKKILEYRSETPIYSSVKLNRLLSLMEVVEIEHEEHLMFGLYQFLNDYEINQSKKKDLQGNLDKLIDYIRDLEKQKLISLQDRIQFDKTEEIDYLEKKWNNYHRDDQNEMTPFQKYQMLKDELDQLVLTDPKSKLQKYQDLPPNIELAKQKLQEKKKELTLLEEKVKSLMFSFEN